MDKSEKRALKKKWQQQERDAAFSALPLSYDQMEAMFDHIDKVLSYQNKNVIIH
jgi:hypothetical protein